MYETLGSIPSTDKKKKRPDLVAYTCNLKFLKRWRLGESWFEASRSKKF
jgi:hypothetical protein